MNDFIKSLAERAGKNLTVNEGDYKQDGILYCGVCNEPKQLKVPLGDEIITPPRDCKCRRELKEANERAAAEEALRVKADRLRAEGLKDDKLKKCTFDIDKQPDNKFSKFARRYCEQWDKVKAENIGLIFYGDTGRGKSFLAACIANELINKGVPVLMKTESDILDELFDTPNKAGYIERIANVPLFIFDDFGTRRDTAYATEQIKKVIDKRYYSEKPTIFTTNLLPDTFSNPKNIDEKRIYERVKAMGQFIEIKGKNWRQDEAAEKAAALMGVLNDDV